MSCYSSFLRCFGYLGTVASSSTTTTTSAYPSPIIPFRHPNLTQFCLSLFELWLVSPKVFRLLRDGDFNYDPHRPSSRFRIAECKATTAFRYHHLTFAFGDFEFAVFPFPRVFRLTRNGSTSATPPLIIAKDGNLDDTIVYYPCNCKLTPSPICVTCL